MTEEYKPKPGRPRKGEVRPPKPPKRAFGRPPIPEAERATEEKKIYFAAPVLEWVTAQGGSPFVRKLVLEADWLADHPQISHDRKPSLTVRFSKREWQIINAAADALGERSDELMKRYKSRSLLIYERAVLPAYRIAYPDDELL